MWLWIPWCGLVSHKFVWWVEHHENQPMTPPKVTVATALWDDHFVWDCWIARCSLVNLAVHFNNVAPDHVRGFDYVPSLYTYVTVYCNIMHPYALTIFVLVISSYWCTNWSKTTPNSFFYSPLAIKMWENCVQVEDPKILKAKSV